MQNMLELELQNLSSKIEHYKNESKTLKNHKFCNKRFVGGGWKGVVIIRSVGPGVSHAN